MRSNTSVPATSAAQDRAARRRILETSESIIVKAPAGSGKTELLVQRYLSLLAYACENPRQALAITFTRKAAAEMRARIRRELQQTTEPQEEHKKRTFKIAQALRAKAQQQNWNLDRLISQETVTTIDAFCRTLLALDPLKGGFFTMPDIVEEDAADQLYGQAVRASIQAISTEKKDSLRRQALKEIIYMHGNDIHHLEQNFVQLLKQRAPLLLAIMKEDNDLGTGIAVLCNALVERIQRVAPLELLMRAASLMEQGELGWCREYSGQNKQPPFRRAAVDIDWQNAGLDEWQNLTGFLLTIRGSLRKKVNKGHGFQAKTAEKEQMESLLKDFAAAHKPQADGHPSEMGEFLYYLNCSLSWNKHYAEQEIRQAEVAADLFKMAAAELLKIFKAQAKCDYTEIMLAALQIMEQRHAPSLLAEWLGYQLRHILVDEFQDTSTGQLRLLESLCHSWDAASNNTLFLVGDPMQSIYAFRQADVRIFNRLWEERRLGQVPLQQVVLSRNFRSQEPLVNWCNVNFRTIFPPVADNLLDAVVHTPAQAVREGGDGGDDGSTKPTPSSQTQGRQRHQDDTGVVLLGSRKTEDTNIFANIIAAIKILHSQQPAASIAILVPSRNHIKDLVPLLQEHKLKFNAAQIFASIENPHIMDLLSLTRALYDFSDRLAWYSCLRAPWCGLKLADLVHLSEKEEKRTTWQTLMQLARAKVTSLSADGLQRIQHFVRCLNEAVSLSRRANWSDLIRHTWQQLGGNRLLETEQDQHETELFFTLLQENTQGASLDMEALTNQLNERGAVFESDSPIQLMTIHSAKGLEFDYVFLPVIHKSRGRGRESDPLLLASDFFLEENHGLTLFATHSPTIGDKGEEPAYEMLKSLKNERELQEYRRLFYVACTRARQRLYLHYILDADEKDKVKAPMEKSFLGFLWQNMKDDFRDALEEAQERAEPAQDNRPLQRIPLNRLSESPPLTTTDDSGRASLFSWRSPEDRAQGLLIHRLLEKVTKMNLSSEELSQAKTQKRIMEELRKDLPYYENQLAETGIRRRRKINQAGLAAIEFTLQDAKGRWLLSRGGESELSLARRNRSSIRLDRMFMDKDLCWIVDYKTSNNPDTPFSTEELEDFHRQLLGYAAAVAAMKGAMPIALGVYCPQNGFWKEWRDLPSEWEEPPDDNEWQGVPDDYEWGEAPDDYEDIYE